MNGIRKSPLFLDSQVLATLVTSLTVGNDLLQKLCGAHLGAAGSVLPRASRINSISF